MRRIGSARLDPVGRLRLPRRTTTLRAGLVALLLVTAVGVLYTGGGDPPAPPGPLAGTTPSESDTPDRPGTPLDPGAALPNPQPTAPVGSPPAESRLPIPDGLVGVPVPLADPTGLAVLHPGDQVDLFAVPDGGGEPASLAERAPVLAVDRAAAALLLALTPAQGRAVVTTPASTTFAVIVR